MKKLVNRLMATVLASSCMFSALTMNSNAERIIEKIESEESLLANGYTKFDDHRMLYKRNRSTEVIGTYTDGESYYVSIHQPDHIYIETSPEVDSWNIYVMLYDKYKGKSGVFKADARNDGLLIYDLNNDMNLRENVKSIMNDVMEMTEIYKCTYADSMEWIEEVGLCLCEDITDYIYIKDDDVEKLQNFVEENNLDFTVEVSDIEKSKRCHLIPNEGVTIDEQFEVAALIKQELNIKATDWMMFSEGTYIGDDEVIEVDVLNAVDGDANEDGNVNMADATAVVQAIGNPDKYALSPQGEFNADVDGNGLTGMDAIEIQMKVASAGMPE